MEEKKIQEIFDALKSEALSERERFVMRSELHMLMKAHPLKVPFHIRFFERMSAFDTAAFDYVGSHGIATAALVCVLVVGVGTSYAAGGALPGDALYPVKININEKFEAVLASDVEKVALSQKLTERRLEEAEILAARGELTPLASTKIASLIDVTSDEFEKRVAMLSEIPENIEIVRDAHSTLEASLVAHANVLSTLSTELPDVSKAIKPILSNVQKRADNARVARTEKRGRTEVEPAVVIEVASGSEAKIEIDSGTIEFEKKVSERKKKLSERLREVRTLAEKEKSKIGTSTYARVQQKASSTEATIVAKTSAANEKDQSRLLEDLEDAIRRTEETRVGLKVQINLHDNIRAANIDFTSDTSAAVENDDQGQDAEKGNEENRENIIRSILGQ
jgi:hypothetical protein